MNNKVKSAVKLIRPHQYTKNLFIFLPLFFVGNITDVSILINGIIGFLAFSASASAIYILNDYLDVEDDRKHPEKKDRPLAAGLISKNEAFTLIGVLITIGITIMLTQSWKALIALLLYVILNIFYCFILKHIAIVDITIIAIGFILRLFVGSFVTGVPLTKWIVIMTFLLALFIALAKRRNDITHFLNTGEKMRKVIDGYNLKFIDGSMMIMASVVIVAYLQYTTSPEVIERFNSQYLYLTSFFVIIGVMRYMQISFVEDNSGSPTKILLKDKFTIINILGWLASFVYLIYF